MESNEPTFEDERSMIHNLMAAVVDHSKRIKALVEEIKELRAKIAELENKKKKPWYSISELEFDDV